MPRHHGSACCGTSQEVVDELLEALGFLEGRADAEKFNFATVM